MSHYSQFIKYANLAAFPVTGDFSRLYLAIDTNRLYIWNGSAYDIINSETQGWNGEVNTYADLPDPSLHNGEVWLVTTASGIWPMNRPAGLWISNGSAWTNAPMTAGALFNTDIGVTVQAYDSTLQDISGNGTTGSGPVVLANGALMDSPTIDSPFLITPDIGAANGDSLTLDSAAPFFTLDRSNEANDQYFKLVTLGGTWEFGNEGGSSFLDIGADGVKMMSFDLPAEDNRIIVRGSTLFNIQGLNASQLIATNSIKDFVSISSPSLTELGYVGGVTSAIQPQIDGKQPSDSTLTALAAYNTNGILTQTAADTFTGRIIMGTANQITVENGNGVSDNPTISLPSAIDGIASISNSSGNLVLNNYLGTNNLSTGVLSGGVGSVNAGNPAHFDISDGYGIVMNNSNPNAPTYTKVTWSGLTNIAVTGIATAPYTLITIDSTGTVKQYPFTKPNATLRRNEIIICTLAHPDLTTIDFAENYPVYSANAVSDTYDLGAAVGYINLSGNIFTANGANLTINKTSGSSFAMGGNYQNSQTDPNTITNAALTTALFAYAYNSAVAGIPTITAPTTTINPNNYDNGSGTLQSVPNNRWTIQRLYIFPPSNRVFVVYGQAVYNSLSDAIANVTTGVTLGWEVLNGALLRGWLIVKQGTTALNNTSENAFKEAGKFGDIGTSGSSAGGSFTNLQQAYNNSTTQPEIITNSANGGVMLQRGSAADTDVVLAVHNGANTPTWWVTGNGDINSAAKLLTLNKGGAASSGSSTGIQVEENSVITAQFRVTGDRAGWFMSAPGKTGSIVQRPSNNGSAPQLVLDAVNISANRTINYPDASTTLVGADTAQNLTNKIETLRAGTATAGTAPLKFTSGTNLTTAEAGAVEYNGTNLFFTRSGTTRENVLCGNDAAAAPATNAIGTIVDYYGTSATRVLTTPNSWASVNISGTTYKIPLYS